MHSSALSPRRPSRAPCDRAQIGHARSIVAAVHMRVTVLLLLTAAACSGTGEPARPSGTAPERDPSAPAKIVEVDAGNYHTCVRLDDGTVECWGQCGRQCGLRPDGSTERIAVAGITNAVELAVSDAHACARLSDGEVACWGSNYRNLLGRLEPDDSSMPLVVPDVHDAVEIAIGGDLTCARLKDGGAMCWGPSAQDHEQSHEAAVARLPKRVEGLTGAQSIAVTGAGACARTGVDAWKCWGWDSTAPDWTPHMRPAVPDARKAGTAMSTDGVCTCDLGIDGVVRCVGSGILSAQLADGSSPPVQLHHCPADGLTGVRTLGDRCAIMTDDTVRCWGSSFFPRAATEPKYADLREPIVAEGISDVAAIAIGSGHTCVLSKANELQCWGSNAQGQIDGKPSERGVWPPVRIDAARAH